MLSAVDAIAMGLELDVVEIDIQEAYTALKEILGEQAKEDLLELKLLKQKTNDPDVLKKISSVENKIKHTVEAFKKYGSQNW